jgi:hypothetical protein
MVREAEAGYSMANYGKILCRPCQDSYQTKNQIAQRQEKRDDLENKEEKDYQKKLR